MNAQRPFIVVDAANVVGARPDGWWRDRPGAARRLVAALGGVFAEAEAEVVVVLEGAARRGAEEGYAGGVRVVHAPGSGDDAIVELVTTAYADAGAARELTVVTADRGLRARVGELGAETVGPSWLWRHLDKESPR